MSNDLENDTFVYQDFETDFLAMGDGPGDTQASTNGADGAQSAFYHRSHSNSLNNGMPSNFAGESLQSSHSNSFINNPVQPSDKTNISFNIPGAFKENDYMELDDSPPFTIESDLYFDSQSNNNNQLGDYDQREKLFPHNQYFIRQFKQGSSEQQDQQDIFSANVQPQRQRSTTVGTDEVSPNSNAFLSNVNTPNPSYRQQFETPGSVSGSLVNASAYFNNEAYDVQYDENSIYSAMANENGSVDNHLRHTSIDSHFNGPLSLTVNSQLNPNSSYANELSPLTTTTSITPSVNSVYSNQPSFFSAHQYLSRPSVDVNGSSRNSVDYIAQNRNSIDSGNSASRQPRNNNRYLNFTNSISNYIPFMSDKHSQRAGGGTGESPVSVAGPPSPISSGSGSSAFMNSQPTPRQQSKHLIRSIFKSNPNTNQQQSPLSQSSNPSDQFSGAVTDDKMSRGNSTDVNDEMTEPESFVVTGVFEDKSVGLTDTEFFVTSPPETGMAPEQNKKLKKQKRSLFTRFKTPVKQEVEGQQEFNDNASGHNTSNPELEDNVDGYQSFLSGTPSSSNTVKTNLNVANNGSGSLLQTQNHSQSSSVNVAPTEQSSSEASGQPNYAALFENVGKRKKAKNPTFKKSKKNEKVEDDASDEDSLTNEHSLNGKVSFDSSFSASTSNTSHSQHQDPMIKQEGESEHSMSKRILGSKLIKRKCLKKQADLRDVKTKVLNEGVEVEVDLKTLDLPEETQAFPTSVVNSKSRTRGRKENKEADLSDTSKIYLCNYCSRRFKRQEHLKRHFRSLHTFEKPYDCEICHKKFSRSDNLNQHLKTHKEDGMEMIEEQAS